MKTLRVWKIVVAEEGSLAKDYWMVPARNLKEAIDKAQRDTASGWELRDAVLVEGDFIMPSRSK